MKQIDEIIGHLGAARMQRATTDDKIIADHIDAAYEAAAAMRDEIATLQHRIRELEYEARGGWSRVKELESERFGVRAALTEIRDSHVPDQPESAAGNELAWVRGHVANLRRLAATALASPQNGFGDAQ